MRKTGIQAALARYGQGGFIGENLWPGFICSTEDRFVLTRVALGGRVVMALK